MKRIPRVLTILIPAILLSLSCEEAFDANGPLDPQLVVTTVLSTDRNAQIVRVTIPFFTDGEIPEANTQYDNNVSNVSVRLFAAPRYKVDEYGRSYLVEGHTLDFRDTLLPDPNHNSALGSRRAFVLSPYTLEYGASYALFVSAPGGALAYGGVSVPNRPTIRIPESSRIMMNNPSLSQPTDSIEFEIHFGKPIGGYVARLYLDYGVVKQGEWVSERVEVPISSANPGRFVLERTVYPSLVRPISPNYAYAYFPNGYLVNMIRKVADTTYAHTPIRFDRITLLLLQADANLYSYFAMSQSEKDPRSIRLDQPPVARLLGGGYGLIGAYTLDSAICFLPESFYANHR